HNIPTTSVAAKGALAGCPWRKPDAAPSGTAVERREAQAPTSLGSRPGQGLANLAHPARRYRKARHGVPRKHPKGVSQAPGASRRSIPLEETEKRERAARRPSKKSKPRGSAALADGALANPDQTSGVRNESRESDGSEIH